MLIRGCGPIGRQLAWNLLPHGVDVRVAPAVAWQGTTGVLGDRCLPVHPEHPHRFLAALPRAAAILGFARPWFAAGPGVAWDCPGAEQGEVAASLAACGELGVPARATAGGFELLEGGGVWSPPALPADIVVSGEHPAGAGGAETVDLLEIEAEIEIWAADDGLPGWLQDKVMPVRWHGIRGAATSPRPGVSRHASVFVFDDAWTGARWAEPHLGVGDREEAPVRQQVVDRLAQLAGVTDATAWSLGTAESCDGLPIVGPFPGRPRVHACVGFGIAGATWGPACARALADALLGVAGPKVPAELSTQRFFGA